MKSLVEEYFVLRTNAIQRRRFQNDQVYGHLEDETNVRLLRDDNADDIEGNGGVSYGSPSFVSQSEALQYQMARVEVKVDQLHEMHLKHLRRPTLDEESQEESNIKRLTNEITQMFAECHHQIKSIRRNTLYNTSGNEEIIVQNLISYLSGRLQDITTTFRRSQNDYLKSLQAREEKSAQFFDLDEVDPLTEALDQQWSEKNQMLLQDNNRFVQQREQEINAIVQNIGQLNTIFKDLAQMVTEQGTIIDRIDYNIENTNIKVNDGLQQIKKAAMYQKSDKKMHCIIILAVIVILELLILVTVKLR